MVPSDPSKVRFGGSFDLRLKARELYRDGVRLKLRPQLFRVLQILVENAGDVVSREEFQQQLWPSDTFVDFEHGLNSSVKNLRAVLGDSVQEPRYIETIPKIGYRFIAEVEISGDDSGAHVAQSVESPLQASAVISGPTVPNAITDSAPSRRFAVMALSVTILGLLLGSFWWRQSRIARASHPARIMMAVLPFENLTGDPSQEYVTDGLTEEIISRLGQADPATLP